MQTLLKTFRTIFEKKIFVIHISFFVLIVCLLDLMNPFYVLVKGLFTELSGNWIDNMIVLVNNIMNRNTILFYMLITFAIALGLGIVLSAFFSGILYLLSKTVDNSDYRIKSNEYVKGFLMYFVRLTVVLFVIIYLILLLFFSYLVMISPTLIIGKITESNPDGIITFKIFLIVSLVIMYLLFLIVRIYLIYMIPACFKTTGFLRISLKVAGSSFIHSLLAFLFMDLFYVGMISFLGIVRSGLLKFILAFLMNSCFWSTVIVWLFYHFNHTIIKKNIPID